MKLEELETIEQLSQFIDGTQVVIFDINTVKKERYEWIRKELVRFNYLSLSKADKGITVRYLMKVSSYSRQQITRLIGQYRNTGNIKHHHVSASRFQSKYTKEDIRLLAKMDELHETPCGQAIKKLCERAYTVFKEQEYERLSNISVSHIYNLRKSRAYTQVRRHYEKTKRQSSTIGERRKPQPNEQPGFIRMDTVHQGDLDKKKGVYHINAVDEVTQFEVVCTVEKISERYLIPALEQILSSFPFQIQGFHSDNGSEYINKNVERLLGKLFIEFTKSRSRHSNDNALAESKNASIVRKVLGYQHIPQKWAQLINEFNQENLNPHVNYHRPCLFPKTIVDHKGKERKRYPYQLMMTPYEKLKSLPDAKKYLKDGVSFETIDAIAYEITDNQSAERLQKSRRQLFETINERELITG